MDQKHFLKRVCRLFSVGTSFTVMILFGVAIKSLAQGATLKGTVVLEKSSNPPVQTHLGGYTNMPQGSSYNKAESSTKGIVIWLEAKGTGLDTQKNPNKPKRILDQADKHFSPRLMVIRVGDVVRIRNSDPVYHNVFSLSKTKRFDVGRRSPGDFQDVEFNEAGKIDVFCDIHSDMHAVIMVASKQTIAMTKMDVGGKFMFKNIPKGNYTLHFYALGDRSESIDLEVADTKKITLQTIRLGF